MEDDLFVGQYSTVTGWGKTADDEGAADAPYFAHDIPIMTNDDCVAALGTVDAAITDEMICIDTSVGSGICSGDSGGPLNLQPGGEEGAYGGPYTQVGVTSWGPNAGCETGMPSVFARLNVFLDWIRDTTGYDI